MQSLVTKSRIGFLYQEKCNVVGKVYRDDFKTFTVKGQLRLPLNMSNYQTIRHYPIWLMASKCLLNQVMQSKLGFQITKVDFSCAHNNHPPLETSKLNVHKTFRRLLLNILCTFNLPLVTRGFGKLIKLIFVRYSTILWLGKT